MRVDLLAVGALLLSSSGVSGAQSYHLVDQWKLGGAGGWDYLLNDEDAHRLYITHGPAVEVLDTRTGAPVGTIAGLKGTHGVALNPDGKTGYISDGAANAIVVFDRATLMVKQTVTAGTNPDGIAFEPTTRSVWAFNGRSNDVSVMDTATNQVVATIPLPGKPEFPQADGEGRVFVNIEDKNLIVELDAKRKAMVTSWALEGCDSPSGLAIDREGHRLFSVCGNKTMLISDYQARKVIGQASIGAHPDAARYDPGTHLAFSSNGGDGTLSVIDAGKPGYPSVQTVATQAGARTMTLESSSGKIFLATADFGPLPEPTESTPHPRPPVLPGSFRILVVAR